MIYINIQILARFSGDIYGRAVLYFCFMVFVICFFFPYTHRSSATGGGLASAAPLMQVLHGHRADHRPTSHARHTEASQSLYFGDWLETRGIDF